MPKISVIIPLYNHEKYIKETIYSVLNQTITDFELLIINDGSSDRSEDIVKDIKDERIQYIYQENQGAHKALNRGISLAKGEYVSILNSDDLYYPERLEECLDILENNESFSAVFSEVEFIDSNGNHIQYVKAPEDDWNGFSIPDTFEGQKELFLKLLSGNFLVSTSNLFCRRDIFDKIGYFSNFKYTHDYEFFLRLCYQCKVFLIASPLLKYRLHDLSSFKTNEAEVHFEVGIILMHVFLNYDLFTDKEEEVYSNILLLFKSLNTYHTDRMIMILLLLQIISPEFTDKFWKNLLENSQNPFREICIEKFKTHLDLWKYSQDAWKKWKETNEKLIAKEHELNIANEKLIAKEHELNIANERIDSIRNSYSYRIGRFLTWPIRKILQYSRSFKL